MAQILDTVAERQTDHILAVRSGGEWAICLCAKGQLVANFLPSDFGDGGLSTAPTDQLAAYARSRTDGVTVDVYEETRVGPAGDVILVTPETQGRLVEVFLKVNAKVREEETVATRPLELVAEAPLVWEGTPEVPAAFAVMAEEPPAWEGAPEVPAAVPVVPEEPLVLETESPPASPPFGPRAYGDGGTAVYQR